MGKQFTSDFDSEEPCGLVLNLVNKVEKFFWFHSLSTFIPNLFTGVFWCPGQSFTCSIDADKEADWTVCNISEEDSREEELFKEERRSQAQNKSDKGSEVRLRLPVDVFETWVRDVAYHQESDRQHERWNQKRETP